MAMLDFARKPVQAIARGWATLLLDPLKDFVMAPPMCLGILYIAFFSEHPPEGGWI